MPIRLTDNLELLARVAKVVSDVVGHEGLMVWWLVSLEQIKTSNSLFEQASST
jgi:hypothetical protein